MEITQSLALASLLLFGYVAARFAWEMKDARRRRGVGGAGILFAVLPPASGYLYQRTDGIRAEDTAVYAIGSIVWVTVALAFAAFYMSRSRSMQT